MKGLLIGIFVVAFAVAGSAQVNKSMTDMAKGAASEMTSDEQDKQIKEALMKDEELQKETIEHMMENEDTKKEVGMLSTKAKGSKKGIIEGILKNEMLTKVALDYIKSKPDLLQKAMSLVGM